MDEECCEVVVTAADADWLAGFTRTLVEERLAAFRRARDELSNRIEAELLPDRSRPPSAVP